MPDYDDPDKLSLPKDRPRHAKGDSRFGEIRDPGNMSRNAHLARHTEYALIEVDQHRLSTRPWRAGARSRNFTLGGRAFLARDEDDFPCVHPMPPCR